MQSDWNPGRVSKDYRAGYDAIDWSTFNPAEPCDGSCCTDGECDRCDQEMARTLSPCEECEINQEFGEGRCDTCTKE